jgi:lysophospholipase L1-like esterase
MRKWEQNGLAQKDKIHFTKKGYQLIGDVFYNALVSSYLEKE